MPPHPTPRMPRTPLPASQYLVDDPEGPSPQARAPAGDVPLEVELRYSGLQGGQAPLQIQVQVEIQIQA